ncbi:MAG: DCC1-like thiol-disulfide oxidoreductase family protein [Bacteroidota bacterium]|nr:DCC1-like thiol-disulfide oxidoreductase family protein [Candidatus Kapabacteria bacterium]MDW8220076.1 DCC1-like thiol-disulfide oxidoreductase family protein [Bacteroidota bacterium]
MNSTPDTSSDIDIRSPYAQNGTVIVFFDGACNLCNRAVQWLLEHDKQQTLVFAPLQGTTFSSLVAQHPSTLHDMLCTIVLYAEGHCYIHSTAVLKIGEYLGGVWKALSTIGRTVPRPIRDGLYTIVSRYRYRWFGKYDSCRVPTLETAARFLP